MPCQWRARAVNAFGGSIGYRIGGARVEVGIGHERFVIKGGDDTAFLLGRELALDTARGQLLSSALGRMSMGDVRRLKKEVVGSIGRGTASPVRAMFSREISDGDTLLAGEMVGVDEGLVIQELSRPEELEKLQHELAKQVSKLAELGELKWLEQLETLETEELQGMKKALEELKIKEVKAAKGKVSFFPRIRDFTKAGKESELLKKLKEVLEEKKELLKVEHWKHQGDMLKNLKQKLEELAAIRGLKGEIEKINEPGELEALEAKKLEEVKAKLKAVKEEVGEGGGHLRLEAKKLEAVKEALKKLGGGEQELVKLTAEELRGVREELKGGETKTKIKDLKKKLEELAAIRELKALGLEEQLKTLAEIKEVKGLAEKQKAGGLEIQEGLQLTERIRGLQKSLVWLEEKKLAEVSVAGALVKRRERGVSTLKEKLRKLTVEELKKTDTAGALIKEVKELIEQPGATPLQGRGELKNKLEELKELEIVRALRELDRKHLGELKKELEAKKLQVIAKQGLVEQGISTVGSLFGLVGRIVTGTEKLGDALKDKEVVKLERQIDRIKALEELTEIAEKRGVATVMKAALTNAMEITKNRGWTDYLNSLDVSERANAARELIAAEKIRKWARDINNLDADERAMVAGACPPYSGH
ncbi:P44/Msp2 family outer membrane protein [Anaplasma marginale]|nr:P44/Msp2 family outer membrane protein [Anaplasma marginale]